MSAPPMDQKSFQINQSVYLFVFSLYSIIQVKIIGITIALAINSNIPVPASVLCKKEAYLFTITIKEIEITNAILKIILITFLSETPPNHRAKRVIVLPTLLTNNKWIFNNNG